jgi:hypothetical protein
VSPAIQALLTVRIEFLLCSYLQKFLAIVTLPIQPRCSMPPLIAADILAVMPLFFR